MLGIVRILWFRHFFLHFFYHWMDKMEKSSKMSGNFPTNFLPFIYQKVKNHFWFSKRHPLATIDVMQLNIPALNMKLVLKSTLNPDVLPPWFRHHWVMMRKWCFTPEIIFLSPPKTKKRKLGWTKHEFEKSIFYF